MNVNHARIEQIQTQLENELGVRFADYPAYEGSELGPFPRLSAEDLDALERGEGKAVLAKTIDHTVLKAETTPEKVDALCDEAKENQFISVCVNGCYVSRAVDRLSKDGVKVAAVIGFPLGAMSREAKVAEAKDVVQKGAGEIDMVLNVGLLKAKQHQAVLEEIADVVKAAGGVPVKVILETCLLNEDEKIIACLLCVAAQAAFVKTSTGFSAGGATADDIALMRACVGDKLGVKASGGVRDENDALTMFKAGANRIGTSGGVAIIQGKKSTGY